MARRVFFSFHYQRDIWRVNVVRQSWVTQDREVAGYWDASLWEEAERKGDASIRRLIDSGLLNTSVTAVLVGAETASRSYVKYEIEKSIERGNGLLVVYINGIKDRNGSTDIRGLNPLDQSGTVNGSSVRLNKGYSAYDWVSGNGYQNFGAWVDAAAKAAGR